MSTTRINSFLSMHILYSRRPSRYLIDVGKDRDTHPTIGSVVNSKAKAPPKYAGEIEMLVSRRTDAGLSFSNVGSLRLRFILFYFG